MLYTQYVTVMLHLFMQADISSGCFVVITRNVQCSANSRLLISYSLFPSYSFLTIVDS